MLKRAFSWDQKSLTESGSFSGFLSTWDKDQGDDIIQKGAFARTLKAWKDKGRKVTMLWQHDSRSPIGVYEMLEEQAKGLYVEGQLCLDKTGDNYHVPKAAEAYSLMQMGALGGQSIGYDTVQGKVKFENGVRYLTEVRLYEGSVVTFPMNEGATIDAVKSLAGAGWIDQLVAARKMDDFDTVLGGIQDRREIYRLRDDISSAFDELWWDILWDEDPADEKMALLETSMDQLATAMIGWAKTYLKIPDASGKDADRDALSDTPLLRRRIKGDGEIEELRVRFLAARDSLTSLLDGENAPLGLGGKDHAEGDPSRSDPESGPDDAPPTGDLGSEEELHSFMAAIGAMKCVLTSGGETDGGNPG